MLYVGYSQYEGITIMLLEFSIRNITSFKDKYTFSLIPTPIKEKTSKLENNVAKISNKISLLKSASIYGANASGKSNLIKSLNSFLYYILFQSKYITEQDKIEISPFILNSETINQASEFDLLIKDDSAIYNYSISINKSEVVSERLTIQKERTSEVFSGQNGKYKIKKQYKIMNDLYKKKMIPKNSLLITKAAQYNDKFALQFFECLNKIKIISGLNDTRFKGFSIDSLENKTFKEQIIEMLKIADPTIEDLTKIMLPNPNYKIDFDREEELQNNDKEDKFINEVAVTKNVYDNNRNIIKKLQWIMNNNESEGTKKFFHLSAPIIDTLQKGYTLFVDELDTKLHPLLVCKIIDLFHNPETNPKNAQLVFTVHNTTLLSQKLFRRDQIWLVDKNNYGESELFSLVDFKNDNKTVRNDEAIEKQYLIGKYGAIPFIDSYPKFNFVGAAHD